MDIIQNAGSNTLHEETIEVENISDFINAIIKEIDSCNYGTAKVLLKSLHGMFVAHELNGDKDIVG